MKVKVFDAIAVERTPRDPYEPRAIGLKALKHGTGALRRLYRFHAERAWDKDGELLSARHERRADKLAVKINRREEAIASHADA